MAKRKAAGLTARQMEALRARVDKRLTIAKAESATGIAGWRLASVLLEALVSRGQLTVNEVVAIIIGAREEFGASCRTPGSPGCCSILSWPTGSPGARQSIDREPDGPIGPVFCPLKGLDPVPPFDRPLEAVGVVLDGYVAVAGLAKFQGRGKGREQSGF
jgi:hypothetical protein